MRLFLAAALGGLVLSLCSCATPTEEDRKTSEAGGALPWNRPASWEGGGAVGSQINEMNH